MDALPGLVVAAAVVGILLVGAGVKQIVRPRPAPGSARRQLSSHGGRRALCGLILVVLGYLTTGLWLVLGYLAVGPGLVLMAAGIWLIVSGLLRVRDDRRSVLQ